jgi:hypothetical protein
MTLGFPDADPNGLPPGRFRGGREDRGILLLIVVIGGILLFALTR